jgi:protein TonB
MLDSTARAERIDLSASEAAFYTWDVAQKPVSVRLPLAFIDRLESEAVENFRSLSSRGSEIGGVLIGSVAAGNPSIVTLADYELLPCDYSRGPLYRLSDADMGRFEQAREKYGQHLVGFFRSHTRKGLALDADDLAFFEPRFTELHHLMLLVRPFATKASTAGIFIRENGKVHGESSYKEFPFRSAELTPSAGASEKSEPASAATPSTIGGTASTSAAKAQARAQIVPIASRREIALPEPVSSTSAPPPQLADRIEAPAPVPAPAPPKVQAVAPVVEKPEKVEKSDKADKPEKAEKSGKADKAEKEKVKAAEKAAEKSVAPAVEKEVKEVAKAAPVVAAAEITVPELPKPNKKLKLVVAAAVAMVALVGGGLFVYPMLIKHGGRPSTVAPQDSSPLSLRVERTSGGMLLTWNRDLPVIQSATKVVLSISDGDRRENIELDPNQVRTGSILYPPITGDVSFQMEVTDPRQSKTTSESLRVLDPRPNPLAETGSTPAGTTPKETAPAKPAAAPTTTAAATTQAAEEAKAPAEEAPKAPAVPLKPFNTASLAQRLRPVTSEDLPEAPAMVRATPAASGNLTGLVTGQSAVAPPPPPSKQATSTPAPVAAPGGQLIPAKVISRVDPEYPKLARQAGASGLVEMEATIGVDGKVKNPRVIHGNAMLQRAAIDAVLQWRYKPAMLNGKVVESPVDIKLEFITGR